MKVLTVVLTFNEELHIQHVIQDIKTSLPFSDILIIDGESEDQTAQLAREAGVWVISIPSSYGIAGGMEMGLFFAHALNYDVVIRMDGDGQHNASAAHILYQELFDRNVDFVLGSRFINALSQYEPSFVRKISIFLFSKVVSKIVGQRIYDTTSGLQVFNKKVICFLNKIKNFEYSEVETLVLLKKNNFRILEIPTIMKERKGGQSSFGPSRSFFYVFVGFFSLVLQVMRKNDVKN